MGGPEDKTERKGVLTSAVRHQLGSGRDTGIHVSGTGKTASTACVNQATDVQAQLVRRKLGVISMMVAKGTGGEGP